MCVLRADIHALEAYYAATTNAKVLVRQGLQDEGGGKWERALQNVKPYISSGQFCELEQEYYSFFQLKGNGEWNGYDTDPDPNETERNDTECDGGSADFDGQAQSRMYESEHMKLSKRYTLRLHRYTRRMLNRSFTTPIMGQRETGQSSSTSFKNNSNQSHTFRSHAEIDVGSPEETRNQEPITNKESSTVSKPVASRAIEEPSFSRSLEDGDQTTKSSMKLLPFTTPNRLMGSNENVDWFLNLQTIAHSFVYGAQGEFWPTRPVKVAILDSGFACRGEAREAMRPYLRQIKANMTFTDEFPNQNTLQEKALALDDTTGHGTTVAYQLLKTCPSAHIFIAKVTVGESNGRKVMPDKGAVARAIRYAAMPVAEGGWEVDIINMSFGWEESDLPRTPEATQGVSGAINFANERGVLLFAAASDYSPSQLNDVLYPARDRYVISVDVDDCLTDPSPFALRSQSRSGIIRYCAPGLSVNSPMSAEPMCRSSFACPVAAGVAALILEFARQRDISLSKSDSVQKALSSTQGMLMIFEPMSQQTTSHLGFRMLYPWHFLGRGQREEVARDVIRQLEMEFGEGKLGREIV
ncbi:peptidase S8/S53 domain-containing protein [Xylaria sp. FL0933]|nr:peptidase S8/S53 domain-containing protein [Xylaria sp. FL0933]